jgi:DNA-binding winged helix-turn-helix (wHTH) protein
LLYRLHDIELDTSSLELRNGGKTVPVEPKVFDLLCLLIENRDRVVSRDELITSVWNGRIVSEATISARMNAARRAVGDDGRRQRVIKTVARRGYRLVAEVEVAAFYKGIEIPADDAARVAALRAYGILDTAPEAAYDDITAVAARITRCRFSYISFCDETRFWLKSKVGYPESFNERPRELSLCPPSILQTDLLIVEDMRKHPRYKDLPSVKNPPHTRFYCAMPLINPEGHALGTLCVWDPGKKSLDEDQLQSIRILARQVLALLQMRRRIIELEARHQELVRLVNRMSSLMEP